MKLLISVFCLISLFSYTYGQAKIEKPVAFSFLKPDSKTEVRKKFDVENKKPEAAKKTEETEETPPEKRTEIQINTNLEFLSKNLGTWKSTTINFRHDFSRRKVLYGFYQKVYRASLASDTATVGFYQPLSKKHSLLLETSTSPGSRFLPKWSGLAQLETKVGPTTFINTGYRFTIYNEAKVHIGNVGIEKYWKSYRFAYNAYLAGAKSSGATFTNRLQADKYYGKHSSSLSVDVSLGTEIQSIFTNGAVSKSSVQSVGIGGKHWINKQFGLNWKASFHRQGEFYSRGGTSFGAIFRF